MTILIALNDAQILVITVIVVAVIFGFGVLKIHGERR